MVVLQVFRSAQNLERQGAVITSDFYDRYGLFPWQRSGTWRSVLEWTLACPTDISTAMMPPSRVGMAMEQLGMMPTVRRLNLMASDVCSRDLKHLTSLVCLEDLNLSSTAIDDSALDSLTSLPNLRVLDLSETSISDAALPRIANMLSLKSVNLAKTNVSRHGLRDLSRARPDLAVPRPARKKMRA